MTAGLATRAARVALIGAGGIGRAHAEAAASLDAATLVGIADVNRDVAAAVAEQYDTDANEVADLADPDRVDLAVIASPPATHPAVVEPFLRAGVAVMCEKPLAVDAATARSLAALEAETGTPLTMAAKFRFVDEVRATRDLVAEGALGEIVKVEVSFAGRVAMNGRWNADRAIAGGGVLIDNATHGVDLVRYLVGDLTEVLAVPGPGTQGLSVEDSATLLARTARGAIAQVDVTWSFRRLSPVYCAVHGSEGTVEISWSGARRTIGGADPVAFGSGYGKISALRANLAEVLTALATGQPLPVSPADAVAAALAIDAAYASMDTARFTPLAPA